MKKGGARKRALALNGDCSSMQVQLGEEVILKM